MQSGLVMLLLQKNTDKNKNKKEKGWHHVN